MAQSVIPPPHAIIDIAGTGQLQAKAALDHERCLNASMTTRLRGNGQSPD